MRRITQKALLILLALLLAMGGISAVAEATELPAATAEAEPAADKAGLDTEQAQWTVMIYLCGTDLESNHAMATYNLEEIAKTTANQAVNVVVQTGGTSEWHAKESLGLDIASDKLQRYAYGADGYTLVEEQPLDNMAAAGTLTDFVTWGARSYPAEKYMLLLWDHGGGSLSGLIVDELHNGAIMTLEQLKAALDGAGVPLEALVLDTCLMASLETAQAVKNSAKYLVASEETVPGKGSAFQTWLQYLYNNPACDGARFGKVLCDATQQKYAELGMSSSARQLTFSVIDLSKIDAVSKAFDDMFVEIGALLSDPESFFTFGYFTQHMQHYAYETMVDLADMARRAQNVAISNDTANAVIEAVDAAVVYNLKGDLRSYSHGLSFYYQPAASGMQLDHYARTCNSAPYLAFLDATNMGWAAPAWVYEQTAPVKDISRADYIVETAANLSAEGLPLLTITNAKSAAAKVDAILFQYEKASDTWLVLGESEKVDGDFDTGKFTMQFPDKWHSLNGSFCNMSIVEETSTHTLYNIPFQLVLMDDLALNMQFRLAYVYDTPLSAEPEDAESAPQADGEEAEPVDPLAGHYEFYGVWDMDSADSTALPSRSASEISSYYGYPIRTLMRRVTLPDYDDMGYAYAKTFTLGPNLSISEAKLPKGAYAMVFSVTDVFGQEHWTSPVYVAWNGKTATYSGVEPIEDAEAEEAAEVAPAEVAQ